MVEIDPAVCIPAALQAQAGVARVGIAVSGGGDSLAALVLAVEALGAGAVSAVTVDHGLRASSDEEARAVGRICVDLGVDHTILPWQGDKSGNLQDAAREARLRLIGAWAQGRVDAVIVAHTRDDQAETLLMRLARGSGVDGLSGMAAARWHGDVLWLRPFLTVSREALRVVLRVRGITWIDDPSNHDPRFQRVRARQALAALAPLGLDAAGLAETATRMGRARQALEAQAQAAMEAQVSEDRGTVVIAKAALALQPEIRDRLFAHLLMALSGSPYRPRLNALLRLIADHGARMGCVLADEGAALRLFREAQAVGDLTAPVTQTWDGRWTATGPDGSPTAEIRAMGAKGLAQLSQQAKSGQHPHWRDTGLAQPVLQGLPGIWENDRLIAAPLALWPQKWQLSARPVAAMGKGLTLSH